MNGFFWLICNLQNSTAEISSRIAKHLGPECIRLGHIVHEIDTTNSDVIKVTVEVKGSAQEPRRVFYGKHLVVTIPPSLYRTIIWKPNLPTLKAEMGENMPMGSIIKTVMYYKKSCWRDRGLSGEVFDPTPESPVVYCVDDTKPDGSYPAIMGFVTADAGLRLQELDIKERQEIISNHYKTALGIMQEPIGYLEKNWNNEPFVGGCYMNTCPPGVVTSFMKAIRQTTAGGRVHFAGTETAIRWAGYMDGAVESGFRAAAEILNVPFDYRHRPKQSLIPGKPVDFTTLERAMPSIGTLVKTSAVGAVVVAAGVMAGIAVRNV